MPNATTKGITTVGFENKRGQSGFTLIEFAIVMTIGALLLSAALQIYADHVKRAKMETTYQRIFEANTLMAEAMNVQGRYFCPADPNLSPADPDYGREVDDCDALAAGCTSGASNGVCVGNGIASGLVNNRVVIGMFPFKTFIEVFERERATVEQAYAAAMANPDSSPDARDSLRKAMISMRAIKSTTAPSLVLDGWGNQFTYMVSAALTNVDTVKKTSGSVEVMMNEAATEAASSKGVHFAIVSHGENGNGARNRNGVRRIACDASLSVAERENCDVDGRIVRASVGSLNIDDIVVYNVHTAEVLWEKVACDTDGNGSEESFCLKNKNPGNVGVAISAATIDQKLTVGGNMRAENVESDQLCDASGNNCFSPSLIGGTQMNRCPVHASPNKRYVAEKVANNQIVCKEITLPMYNSVCPDTPGGGKQLVKGYNAGGVVCVDPCREDDQYRTQACPGSGMTGVINLTAHYSCATRSWSSWGEVSNTCSVACVANTEEKSGPCPAGHSGTITYERTRSCPSGTWGAWTEKSRTCTAPPAVCQTFNLTLYSNCNPTYEPRDSVETCTAGTYAVFENSSGVFRTCGAGGPTLSDAISTAKAANCQPLATGQTYKTSGCP